MSSISHHIIVDGHFSINGNFIGLDSNKRSIHVYKIQMKLIDLSSYENIQFPLFALGTIENFDKQNYKPIDLNTKGIVNDDDTDVTFERLVSKAIFKNFEALIDAYAGEIELNERISQSLSQRFDNSIAKEAKQNAEDAFNEYLQYRIKIQELVL